MVAVIGSWLLWQRLYTERRGGAESAERERDTVQGRATKWRDAHEQLRDAHEQRLSELERLGEEAARMRAAIASRVDAVSHNPPAKRRVELVFMVLVLQVLFYFLRPASWFAPFYLTH